VKATQVITLQRINKIQARRWGSVKAPVRGKQTQLAFTTNHTPANIACTFWCSPITHCTFFIPTDPLH
jgi:hypothetical protein